MLQFQRAPKFDLFNETHSCLAIETSPARNLQSLPYYGHCGRWIIDHPYRRIQPRTEIFFINDRRLRLSERRLRKIKIEALAIPCGIIESDSIFANTR